MPQPPGVGGTSRVCTGGQEEVKSADAEFPFPWLGCWEFWEFLSLCLHPQGILAAFSLLSLMSRFVCPWFLSGLTAECPFCFTFRLV